MPSGRRSSRKLLSAPNKCESLYISSIKFTTASLWWLAIKYYNRFLLAVLHVKHTLAAPTAGDMADALHELPENLAEAFKETMQRIVDQPEKQKRIALDCLRWISYARRRLKDEELSDALAMKAKKPSANPKYRPSRKVMVKCCQGLVTVDEGSQIIRLVHYSVHTYLTNNANNFFLGGEAALAELCIEHRMLGPFVNGCHDNKDAILDDIDSDLDDHPFIWYAACEWVGLHCFSLSGFWSTGEAQRSSFGRLDM